MMKFGGWTEVLIWAAVGELYLRGDILILQFRSSVRFGRKKDLVKEILAFSLANLIRDVVVLASLPYELKQDR